MTPRTVYNPWNSPGQSTRVGCLSLLQDIIPTQGSNPGLPHCRQILYQLRHQGSAIILEWVAYPYSSVSFSGIELLSPALQADSLPAEPPGKPNTVIISSDRTCYCSLVFSFFLILFLNFTILYWFCHISKWTRHRHTRVPHPEPSSLLPPRTIPLGCPRAPPPSIQYHASNLDWRLISYMILYMFQCHSPKSSHPHPLPQSPKDCSIHQCLFCCLIYRVIVTIF